ncbi:hypothetical protein CPB84DRAFT_696459 [Gymnopilus junonius]|uniref:Uncharacterized protein n=1 Tax=Gymnopilus junonius TaxID=109634 RepID=A0A9P5NSS1_GYMJU|nr:hypothetical protein CPB84DRAFT_696459 [Gymnopilus junonius]
MSPLNRSSQSLLGLPIHSYCISGSSPTPNFSLLPPALHTLDIRFLNEGLIWDGCAAIAKDLVKGTFSKLRTSILNEINYIGHPIPASDTFWRNHSGLERLELWWYATDTWQVGFEDGVLSNLKYLQCGRAAAFSLPSSFSRTLIRLCIFFTFEGEGVEFLHKASSGGTLPCLRSLSHRRSSHEWLPVRTEKSRHNF